MKSLLNVCRCCLSKLGYKDMFSEYFCLGVKENYPHMFHETFNITISQLPDCCLICEECVVKLRDAALFKQLVLDSEKYLKDKLDGLQDTLQLTDLQPKQEAEDSGSVTSHDACNEPDNFVCDGVWSHPNYADDKDAIVIKLEATDESPDIVRDKTTHRHKLKHKHKDKHKEKIKIASNIHSDNLKKCKEPQTKLEKVENSRNLILNSNMCLFTIRNFKYGCFYCKEKYLEITDLRQHCSETHRNDETNRIRLMKLRGRSYKNVDISDLTCKLCTEKLTDVFHLQNHLTTDHKVQFFEADNLLIPYRLTDSEFKCVICSKKHNNYRMLSIHMHSHFSNYVCETCGMSYVSPISLRNHVTIMHRVKKCSSCPMTFQSSYSRTKHMRKVHQLGVNPKRYCMSCDKTFRYSYQLQEHKVSDHGGKRDTSQCKVCGREFLNKVNLNLHMRSVHLKERNHECSKCEMRFFTKHDLRRHETSHLDVKSFSCGVCDGKFKTKDSWRRHLKKQHGQ